MNLYEKISQVMKDVQYLAKDDNVSTGGSGSYKAISEEKVTSTVRDSLIKNGLVIVPIAQDHSRVDEQITDNYGKQKTNRITSVDVTYRMINIEKPDEFIDIASSGTGVDTQDKGVGKAMTYAYKYMLLRTFAIPTGDDADKISSASYDDKLYGKQLAPDAKEKMKQGQDNFNKMFSSAPPKPDRPALIIRANKLCEETGYDINTALKFYKVGDTNDLTISQLQNFITKLEEKKKK